MDDFLQVGTELRLVLYFQPFTWVQDGMGHDCGQGWASPPLAGIEVKLTWKRRAALS
jgi:hypothetical protein